MIPLVASKTIQGFPSLQPHLQSGNPADSNDKNNEIVNYNNENNSNVAIPSAPWDSTIIALIAFIVFAFLMILRYIFRTRALTPPDAYMRVPLVETSADLELGNNSRQQQQQQQQQHVQSASDNEDNEDDPSKWDEWDNSNSNTNKNLISNNNISKLTVNGQNSNVTTTKSTTANISQKTPPTSSASPSPQTINNSSSSNSRPLTSRSNSNDVIGVNINGSNEYDILPGPPSSSSSSLSSFGGNHSYSSNNSSSAVKAKKSRGSVNEDVDLFASIGIAAKPTFNVPTYSPPVSLTGTRTAFTPVVAPTASRLHSLMQEVDDSGTSGGSGSVVNNKWNDTENDLDDTLFDD